MQFADYSLFVYADIIYRKFICRHRLLLPMRSNSQSALLLPQTYNLHKTVEFTLLCILHMKTLSRRHWFDSPLLKYYANILTASPFQKLKLVTEA